MLQLKIESRCHHGAMIESSLVWISSRPHELSHELASPDIDLGKEGTSATVSGILVHTGNATIGNAAKSKFELAGRGKTRVHPPVYGTHESVE